MFIDFEYLDDKGIIVPTAAEAERDAREDERRRPIGDLVLDDPWVIAE